MIRPNSSERWLRVAMLAAGDAVIAWGCLVVVVLIRRNVDFSWTRSVLPAQKFPLDLLNVSLFVLALLLSMALSGFYNL